MGLKKLFQDCSPVIHFQLLIWSYSFDHFQKLVLKLNLSAIELLYTQNDEIHNISTFLSIPSGSIPQILLYDKSIWVKYGALSKNASEIWIKELCDKFHFSKRSKCQKGKNKKLFTEPKEISSLRNFRKLSLKWSFISAKTQQPAFNITRLAFLSSFEPSLNNEWWQLSLVYAPVVTLSQIKCTVFVSLPDKWQSILSDHSFEITNSKREMIKNMKIPTFVIFFRTDLSKFFYYNCIF